MLNHPEQDNPAWQQQVKSLRQQRVSNVRRRPPPAFPARCAAAEDEHTPCDSIFPCLNCSRVNSCGGHGLDLGRRRLPVRASRPAARRGAAGGPPSDHPARFWQQVRGLHGALWGRRREHRCGAAGGGLRQHGAEDARAQCARPRCIGAASVAAALQHRSRIATTRLAIQLSPCAIPFSLPLCGFRSVVASVCTCCPARVRTGSR